MERPESPEAESALPQAVVSRRRSFSLVWLIPLVAVLIGGWLVVKALREKGPEITIAFRSAEGLEAGKTRIKYKDVAIGLVEEISLSPDLTGVVVRVSLDPGSEPFLTEKTRFWIVRARVVAGEVSALGTLLSGAYITLDPVREGKPTKHFVGLEVPPVVTKGLPGRHFVLEAGRMGSLDVGAPVYYRQLQVGQVVSSELLPGGETFRFTVFIHAPYHEYVYATSRFWNASGIDLRLDAGGVRLTTESLVAVVAGGIAFDHLDPRQPKAPAEENRLFTLYDSRQEASEASYTRRTRYLLHFDESVRGLEPGAPVEFHGVKIGEVVRFDLEYHAQQGDFRVPVEIELEGDRISLVGELPESERGATLLDRLVRRGLRAQLKSGNMVTGKLIVDIDFHPRAPARALVRGGEYPEIPTIPSDIETVLSRLDVVLAKIEKIPFDEIGQGLRRNSENLNANLVEIRRLTGRFNDETVPELGRTLQQMQQTLAELQRSLGSDSAVQLETTRAMAEVGEAARAVRALTDYLERHPEALIYGKEEEKKP